IALRYELAPVAVVAVIAGWWCRRDDHRRTAILIGGAGAVVLPFWIARMAAWGSVPASAHAAVAGPAQAPLVLRVLLAAAIAAPAACILQLALPRSRALRWAATATAVALGALAVHLTGTGAYSLRLAWPISIAFAIALVIELARNRGSGPSALIAALMLCVLLYEGREGPGRLRWSRRMASAAAGIEEIQQPPGEVTDPYAGMLARVPPGATVAVWVSEPERLDYARHRIVDLRTPAGVRLRAHRWELHASKLAPLLAQVSAAFLLIEEDDAHVQRTQTDLLYRFLCQTARPVCADDLEAIARSHPITDRRDNLLLVDLRR
ncbi:MAG TPA: hypothetical protein VHN14_00110, partial [Kofleriaceae bacterium]|nr:hypothetical protein [Kofleriaceae bacterium]